MPGDADLLRRVRPGEIISAAQWNMLVTQLQRLGSDATTYADGIATSTRREPPPYQIWVFTLQEDLASGATTPVLAVRRYWDQTQNSGLGGYVDGSEQFYVCDHRLVGYCGPSGAHGAAELFNPGSNGLVYSYNGKRLGTIVDLECPPGSEPDCSAYE